MPSDRGTSVGGRNGNQTPAACPDWLNAIQEADQALGHLMTEMSDALAIDV
jgi:hypothetical protein